MRPKDILEKVELKVRAKEGSNYTGESSKKVKFNILGSEINATPIANITFDMTCLKIPAKGIYLQRKDPEAESDSDGRRRKEAQIK